MQNMQKYIDILKQNLAITLLFSIAAITISFVYIFAGNIKSNNTSIFYNFNNAKFEMKCQSNMCAVYGKDNNIDIEILKIPKEIVIKERLDKPENMKTVLINYFS